MDDKGYLQETTFKIETNLRNFLDNWSKDLESPRLLPLVSQLISACEGGKRLRGFLVRVGYEMAGGEKNEDIFQVAVACEIFQTAILSHDDIIDQSPLRRGKPTIFKALGGDHYAISQTIILGDLGFFLAVKLLSQTGFEENRKGLAIESFSQMMIQTALGEMLDVELPHSEGEKLESDVLLIHKLKTAYYTIVHPLSLGAILAGADQMLLEKITQFGEGLGIGFQIQDDILGVFGDESSMGKSALSDIEEGKNTLLITESLKKATPEQKQILDNFYGKQGVSMSEVEQIKQVFVDTGALKYSDKRAQEYVKVAKKLIPQLTRDTFYQQVLREMAEYLIKRQK